MNILSNCPMAAPCRDLDLKRVSITFEPNAEILFLWQPLTNINKP
jgi:hypothetical protein